MSTTGETVAVEPSEAALPVGASDAVGRRVSLRSLLARARPHHAALGGVLALSAVLNTRNLSQNGYANTFYSAAVKSMLHSLHNFVFVSFDPGGLVTIDKPPLALWLQAASAKLFGFSPLSLLLPQAIVSTIAVAALYRVIAPRFGTAAALCSALALAVFPSFVAVSRDNGVDPLLILLMILACGAALAAVESGGWRALLSCAVLIGLAFNTKTLAAYLVVPGIALAYIVCAPGSIARRSSRLLVAGAVTAIVSFSWIAAVELTPASQRPYVGSSTNNSELGLTFDYNGFGRVEGELGGPGQIPAAQGAGLTIVPRPRRAGGSFGRRATSNVAHPSRLQPTTLGSPPAAAANPSRFLPDGRLAGPLFFAREPGPLRLFQSALNDQGAWLLPFALVGLIALGLMTFAGERARRNPRLATMIVFGGWLLVEAVVLSSSKGIVHPYYVSAMGPAAAAMVGAGAVAFTWLARRRHRGLALLPLAVAATVAVQVVILYEQHYMRWFVPVLIAGALAGVCMMAARRLTVAGMALTLGVLLVAPTVFAASTWQVPVEGTFPAAGPHEAAALGPLDTTPADLGLDRSLIRYLARQWTGTRWAVLTDAAPTAAPLILLGAHAGALGGYGGTDPALDGPTLARLVARHEARYVLLGGEYASRGGNLATKAVLRACKIVPAPIWHGPAPATIETLVLFDCAGRERMLSA
ncbi:MAG: glycosyltransferase family 39 protein [Solirubrobacterales bacterium]|nr:glycosyltransferase family 39 protein [Solirubrobacterales bacterium]